MYAVLAEDPRWLRSATVIKRVLKLARVPELELYLKDPQKLADAPDDVLRSYKLYVETLAPLVRRAPIDDLVQLEGWGHFGTASSAPVDPAYTKLRWRELPHRMR